MSKQPLLLRITFLILGIILLPATLSITVVVLRRLLTCQDLVPNVVLFFIGFVSHLIFFLAFRKPMTAYIFGHEMTHALWVMLFRGKVKSIKITKTSGSVTATRINPLIILAPYFFPLYTLIVIGLWLLASYFYPIQKYFPVAVFLIGFTWSFHLLLNLYILRESQQDIRAAGRLFSAVLIYALNVFILGIIITFVSASLTYASFFDDLAASFLLPYRYLSDWILRAYEYVRHVLQKT